MFEAGGIRLYITAGSSTSHRDYIFTLDGIGDTYSPLYYDDSGTYLYAKKSPDRKTLFYYGSYDRHQCNLKGTTYRYIAIG